MKIHVTLGTNTFELDDVSAFSPELRTMFSAWLNAQQEGSAGEALETVTDRLKLANDTMEASVRANTPEGGA